MTTPIPPTPPADPNIPYQGVVYDRDAEHLRLLSIFWYIAAGLFALFGSFPLIHLGIGLFMLLSPRSFGGPGGGPPAFMGWMFTCMGGAFVTFGWTTAILAFLTARALPQRRRILLCQIAAGIACLQVPMGTILGVFTFIVLSRPTIRNTFS
jgi:hypothetical protein